MINKELGELGHKVFDYFWHQYVNCVHVNTLSLDDMTLYRAIIGLGIVLMHVWCQSIIWINTDLLSIGSLGTNVIEILIKQCI